MATISQDAKELGLEWVQGDPISLAFTVQTVDWSGTYTAQVRRRQNPTSELMGTFVVTSSFTPGVGTAFTLSMSSASSTHVPAGDLYWDLQQVGGVTRLRGVAHVVAQVTV